ncbi:MAG: hypothetical protein AAF125_21315 [Chloroflexota bacterium]
MNYRYIALILSVFMIGFGVITAQAQAASLAERVEVVFDRTDARAGQIVNADVFVRGANNLAGVDIELATDDCLRVVDLQAQDDLLPMTDSNRVFTVRGTYSDHSARLAGTVIGRDITGNGDGLYMRVPMRVLCDTGAASVDVVKAEMVDDLTQFEQVPTVGASLMVDGRTFVVPWLWIIIGVGLLGVVGFTVAFSVIRRRERVKRQQQQTDARRRVARARQRGQVS